MPSPVPIPVALCIDVEPDGLFIDRHRPEPWRGFEESVRFFTRFRDRLRDRGRQAAFTWCLRMDPQVAETYGAAEWVAAQYAALVSHLAGEGDEMGLHVHAYRWDETAGRWTVDHGNEAWIDHCVRSSFTAFERAFGRPCRTFRFGDRWMSNAVARLLGELGVRYDVTLEPGHGAIGAYHPEERFTGSLPDYTDVPREPYLASPDDYRRPASGGSAGMWMVPVTTAPVRARLLRRWYYRLREPHVDRGVWTALVSHDPALFRRIAEHALERASTPYLALVVRAGALAAPRLAKRVSANLEALLRHPLADRLIWQTPAGLVASLGSGECSAVSVGGSEPVSSCER